MDVLEATETYVVMFAQKTVQHAPVVKIHHSNLPGAGKVKLAVLQQEIVN